MDANAPLSDPVAELISKLELRANSLIITLFGDAIVPRGGNIWLGSLIDLLRPFGISERLVRTGVYRLSHEGWLHSQSSGRRSYYTLTPSGRTKFAEADRRIYASQPPPWDHKWRLVQVLSHVGQTERQALRRDLRWHGFGQLSPTLLAHPTAETKLIETVLDELGMRNDVFVFTGELADFVSAEAVGEAATVAWELDALNDDYARFLKSFSAFSQLADSKSQLSTLECFVLRVLLIHDYRRILLKDPLLPKELLPAIWDGDTARTICAGLYAAVADRAETHLVGTMETLDGTIPDASVEYERRFTGTCAPASALAKGP
jgi:phenylacetic acid degradation operon negative regulatory protein